MSKYLLHSIIGLLLLFLLPAGTSAQNSKTTVTQVSEEVTLMTDVDYIITDAEEPFGAEGSVNIVSTGHAGRSLFKC